MYGAFCQFWKLSARIQKEADYVPAPLSVTSFRYVATVVCDIPINACICAINSFSFLSVPVSSDIHAKLKCHDCRNDKKRQQTVSKQQPCHESASIVAFVWSQQLHKAVCDHRYHQQERYRKWYLIGIPCHDTNDDTCKLTCTSGTYRKLLSVIMKRPLFFAMAAKYDRQPFIQPISQRSLPYRPIPTPANPTKK